MFFRKYLLKYKLAIRIKFTANEKIQKKNKTL